MATFPHLAFFAFFVFFVVLQHFPAVSYAARHARRHREAAADRRTRTSAASPSDTSIEAAVRAGRDDLAARERRAVAERPVGQPVQRPQRGRIRVLAVRVASTCHRSSR